MPSTKKRRHSVLESSDSEAEGDGVSLEQKTETGSKRQSSRLVAKQNKPSFKLPSRDAIWKNIPSVKLKDPERLSLLSPRKSVNNFTKVYNSYNYDDYEDTGDEESESSSDSSDETKTGGRVKNFHKRIQVNSSSSDEDESKGKIDSSQTSGVEPSKAGQVQQSKETDSDDTEQNRTGSCAAQVNQTERNRGDSCVDEGIDLAEQQQKTLDSEEEEEELVTPRKKRSSCSLSRSVLDSDDDTEEEKSEDKVLEALENSSGTSGTGSETSSDSGSEGSVGSPQSRAANLKQKQKTLFSDFKDAISKRKAKSQVKKRGS